MAKASFPNVLEKYVLPYVKSDALVQRWRRGPMLYWQNQSKLCSLLRDNRLWNAFDNSYDRSAYEKYAMNLTLTFTLTGDKSRVIIRVFVEYTITGLVILE